MFHVIFLVKRKNGMSQEQFADYWIHQHTPLTAAVPGVLAYRCYVATGSDDGEPAYDGVAVLSFADEDAYRRGIRSPEFAIAAGDAPKFQDVAGTTSLFASEHVIV